MAASDTRQKLTSGGYLGMLNVLMQLRKVCLVAELRRPSQCA